MMLHFLSSNLSPRHRTALPDRTGTRSVPDGLTRKQRIAKMRAELAADSSDDEVLQVDVKPKKPKVEVKAEKGIVTKGKTEILVLSDSD
jgi:hypothetical protein